jgi:hypothetical protein
MQSRQCDHPPNMWILRAGYQRGASAREGKSGLDQGTLARFDSESQSRPRFRRPGGELPHAFFSTKGADQVVLETPSADAGSIAGFITDAHDQPVRPPQDLIGQVGRC